ncbi:hypothetical protein KFE25_011524 [Diacronema lutheri]|uniref:DUF2470 domain-containing protein n=1 Tax=Diacronema lutheri TaxID=2081491 RepID=A0A8J5XCY6_DIALT|nr:hypothetical protein KFE25_011524 [Diacronema lutheri]
MHTLARTVQFFTAAALVHRASAFRRTFAAGRIASPRASRSAMAAAAAESGGAAADAEREAMQRFMAHQKTAAKLPYPVQARSVFAYAPGYAVLSTLCKADEGYPAGAVVGFAPGADGLPIFFLSSISGHTQDLLASSKASLTVTAGNFDGADSARVNLLGDVRKLTEPADVAAAREVYLAKHKDAYWIDFGDFAAFRMTELRKVRFVGGFAGAADVAPADYLATAPDAVLAYSAGVASHMNDDHRDSTAAMVRHYVGLSGIEDAHIMSVDSLGMQVRVKRAGGESFKLRLPFPRPAESRKDVKDLIVEMTRASAGAS